MTTIQDRMRDAAAQQAYDLRERDRVVIAALNLARGKRAGDVIHLGDGPGDGTAIVQVHGLMPSNPDQAYYTVVHDGQPGRQYVTTLPLALLYAAQIMTGGRPHDDDYVYAARVLNIPTDPEAAP